MLIAALVGLAACGSGAPDDSEALEGETLDTPWTKTFRVVERDGYRIVDIEASLVAWGGSAAGPRQHARLVLVPKGQEPPPLTGDLAGASLIRTPVERIAVNDQPHEAMLRALGVEDRIVAVGGHNSYDDDLRRMARSGEIQQGLLADIVKMLHPELRDGEFRYLAPENWKASYADYQ